MKRIKLDKKLLSKGLLCAILVLISFGIAWASSEGGHGGGHEVHNSWLLTDWYKVLNFGVLAIAGFVIARKIVPPLLRSRAQGIEDEIKELEQKKADAEKKLAEYQAKFKNLDQESKQIVEDNIRQGEEAKERILAEAKAQADKLEDMAKRNIEQEFKAAKAALRQEIVEKAMGKAEEVIKTSISSKDQNKLVDDYLKKVVA